MRLAFVSDFDFSAHALPSFLFYAAARSEKDFPASFFFFERGGRDF